MDVDGRRPGWERVASGARLLGSVVVPVVAGRCAVDGLLDQLLGSGVLDLTAQGDRQLGGVDDPWRMGGRTPGGVGQSQEKGQNDPVGDERGSTVGQEGKREPGQRDEPGDPADDDEDLQGDGEGQAHGQELAEAVAQRDGDAQPPLDENEVEHEEDERAGQAQLLTQ